ncbi:MAG: ester cyclase [Rhodospirillaceae bacterium]
MRVLTATALTLALSVTAPAAALEIICDGHEDNLNTYLEMTDILFNQRQGERASEYYADEFISHNSDAGGLGTAVRTPDHMTRIWEHSKKNSPDRQLINELIVCAGDVVVARVTMKGTRVTGEMEGNPPNGRRYETTATDTYRFKDGKVVERWGNNDSIAMIRQLGLKVDLSMTPLPEED